ncbi:gp042 [Erwinia phage vB_EamP-S6]|uniref:Gp042 n=1 Tax=Erwinia phage vB_EamP-S6 TaxID=1051675 RepID=G0YQD4_9CAUD|nr:gp042 [Erwinia phage vB_EamP-S6]AEJ81561.1 gp042 [Erwinia phage vB_EamP-S6]
MGCDIHLYRERRINGEWETDTTRECESEEAEAEDPYYSYESGMGYYGRSYVLFAALSGVRSYSAMAIAPPAEDRGFPEDACDIHKWCSEQWDADGHSHGWLDMAELDTLIEQYFQAPVLHDGDAQRFEHAHANLVELRDQANTGDYFKGLEPEDCRILFFYDN